MLVVSNTNMKSIQHVESTNNIGCGICPPNAKTTYMWIACLCPRTDRTAITKIRKSQRGKSLVYEKNNKRYHQLGSFQQYVLRPIRARRSITAATVIKAERLQQ